MQVSTVYFINNVWPHVCMYRVVWMYCSCICHVYTFMYRTMTRCQIHILSVINTTHQRCFRLCSNWTPPHLHIHYFPPNFRNIFVCFVESYKTVCQPWPWYWHGPGGYTFARRYSPTCKIMYHPNKTTTFTTTECTFYNVFVLLCVDFLYSHD